MIRTLFIVFQNVTRQTLIVFSLPNSLSTKPNIIIVTGSSEEGSNFTPQRI